MGRNRQGLLLFFALTLIIVVLARGYGYLGSDSALVSGYLEEPEADDAIVSSTESSLPDALGDEPQQPPAKIVEGQERPMLDSEWKLRVVTYNIQHGRGLDGVVDLERAAAVLRQLDPDIVALQEVDNNFGSRSNWEDQAQALADKLGMQVAYGPALRTLLNIGRGAGYYGNTVLSKYPIQEESNSLVNAPGFKENRAFLHTVIATPVGQVNFISTHLGLDHEHRLKHLEQMLSYVGELTGPVVVAGDFNSRPSSREVRLVQDTAGFQDSAAVVGKQQPTLINNEEARIDYVFASSGVTVWDVETVDTDASDHRPVMALLSISVTEHESQ